MAEYLTLTSLQYKDKFYPQGEIVEIADEDAEELLRIEAVEKVEEQQHYG